MSSASPRRSLAPKTLFGRNMLLIVALIVAALLSATLLFFQAVQEPRLERFTDFAAAHAQAIFAALAALPPDARSGYLDELRSHAGTRMATGAIPASGFATQRPLVRAFLRRLEERLGSGYQVAWEDEPERRLWIGARVDGTPYWLGIDAGGFLVNVSYVLAGVVVGTGALALIGAFLIQRRINRPLQELVAVAAQAGRGDFTRLEQKNAPAEIAHVADALNRMVADLDAAERERALMLAGVSHDLRTPLAKLRLATEMLADSGDPELVESMRRNIAAADRIIDQFIDFARVGSDEAIDSCDLNALAREVAAAADRSRVTLELGELPLLRVRPTAISRAVANLVGNALYYSHGAVALTTSADSQKVRIRVRDRGPGIPAEDIDRMRRPFTRLDMARGGTPGAGLGLAIVERIAKLHRGTLELANAEGGGLEATLVLPRDG